jgi:2'-5' RNA ligase
LVALQNEVETATTSFTNEQREEKFTAHVTVARIKAIRSSEAVLLKGLIESISGRVFGTWTANRIQLVHSELGADGARHTVLAELPFKST